MKRKRFCIHMVVISLMINLTVVSVCFAGSEITNKLKNTINKVISTLNDEALKNDLPARRAILRNTINDQFNYRQMVMRSLAKNWDVRSAEEQQLFIALFKSLLENSYANKLESFSNEKINYLDEVVKGEYALVKTEVVRKATTLGLITSSSEKMVSGKYMILLLKASVWSVITVRSLLKLSTSTPMRS